MDPQKILIVEDERIIALDLKNRLQQLGYEVVGSATNGEAALEKVDQLHPDMVLMDIHLEGDMDGTEAASLIQQKCGTPIIFLSAYATDSTLEKALESAPYGYLLKPIDTRELHATLQATLNRHNLEQQVVRSEKRLQLALDAAAMGVWEWEPGSGRFTTGGLFSQVVGTSPSALDESLDNFLERLTEEDRIEARDILHKALDEGHRIDHQFRYQKADGSNGWLLLYASVHHDNGSAWVTGVVQDVTERHRMEEELRQSAAVFETLSEALFTLSADGRLTSANPAFERLTGYAVQDVIGMAPEDFLHARRHSDQFYQRLLEEHHGEWQGETQCRRSDGTVFPVWESVRAVMDGRGRLSHFVAAMSDISELRRAEEKVHHLAYHDPLTGLPNRLLLDERLDYTLKLMELKQGCCAVMFLDLDDFKLINDTMGHPSGDMLLQIMADRLNRHLRKSDTLARMGGDEFVVVVTDLDQPATAATIARNLLNTLIDPVDLNGKKITVSGSVGIAVSPHDSRERQELLQAADTAMYHAKSQGKNQIQFYTPDMASQVSERMHLEQDLRHAIDNDQLRLHFQPQFRLQDGVMTGVEALVRWEHPELGLVSPASFIPVAEDSGLIAPLGHWVLSNACRQVADWQAETGQMLRLGVNVSVQQIRSGRLIEQIDTVLTETGLPAGQLEIEITESTLQNLEDSRRFLVALHERGIGVAIDDFGTGYSSLSVLKHLPIDRLKIDQSFVRDIPGNPQDMGIVEAIIAMARKLGLEIIAEGIEENRQLEFLREGGCDEGQGYLLARPAPWDQVVKAEKHKLS